MKMHKDLGTSGCWVSSYATIQGCTAVAVLGGGAIATQTLKLALPQ